MTLPNPPKGYHTVTPYLVIKNASQAMEFYKAAFGAVESFRLQDKKSGKIGHLEMKIGHSTVLMADEFSEYGNLSPLSLNGTPVSFCVYVDDVDGVFAQSIEAGAVAVRPLADQFYGDRSGQIRDPFGHLWTLATPIESVSPDEMQKRFDDFMQSIESDEHQ